MKKLRFSLFAAFAVCVMMLTSCMGDSDDERTFYAFGYMDYYGKLNVGDFDYPYASSSTSINPGYGPVIALIDVNYSSELNTAENVASKGYYTATSISYDEITNVSLLSDLSFDPKEKMNAYDNEIVLEGATSYYVSSHFYANRYLSFFPVLSKHYEGQTTAYDVYFSPDVVKTENGVNMYDLYIRAKLISYEESKKVTNTYPDLFTINTETSDAWASIISKEKPTSSNAINSFYIRINYVKSINSDREITWDSVEYIPVFMTTKTY